ncbi:MAG: hypothetical protein E1N59_3225 [Puniceicoccaceae bacterium 5H]|nr:MAG: hypothetical protein E1N59_3225 [Puniceicoccaceae bacterium 5H]
MVLQQQSQVNFWGTASRGETVSVSGSWSAQPVTATADTDGNWSLQLSTPAARTDGTAYTVTVSGTNTITYTDVLIGEVWVLSGQSNMQLPLAGWGAETPIEGGPEAIASADYPELRLMVVGEANAATEQADTASYWDAKLRQWAPCSPTSVGNFSAIGYFFGRELQTELDVPVGLIQCAWGGSSCEAWTSPEDLQRVANYHGEGPWAPVDSTDNQTPSVLWNGMLSPIVPYSMRGVLWYQGETNMGRAEELSQLFPQMIEGWRRAWGQGDFPFCFAHLAPWSEYWPGQEPELWEAQGSALFLPQTGMAVTVDLVDPDELANIHPKRKEPVGHRMALWARSQVYGEAELACSGPLYRWMERAGSSLRLHFDHAAGLKAGDGSLDWFEIAGSDGEFVAANAVIAGETVVVSHPTVSEPTQARYAWSKVASGDLYNGADLPAAPFRTQPADYVVSNLGQPVRSSDSGASGFFVREGRLFDGAGQEFRGYGVNSLATGDPAHDMAELTQIHERSQSNLVRINWPAHGSAEALSRVLGRCLDLGMVPLLRVESNDGLPALAEKLTDPAYLSVLRRFEDTLLLEIYDETAPHYGEAWADAYLAAVETLRTRHGGIRVPLMLDSADWDSLTFFGDALRRLEPEHNLLLGVFMPLEAMNPGEIEQELSGQRADQVPLLLPRLDNQSHYLTSLMQSLADNQVGCTAWAWQNTTDGSDLATADGLTDWGQQVVNGANGIAAQAEPVDGLAAPAMGVDFSTWSALYASLGAGDADDADLDHDGLTDYEEYLFGLSPAEQGWKPATVAVSPAGAAVGLPLSTDASLQGTFDLQSSTDLVNWETRELVFDPVTRSWALANASAYAEVVPEEGFVGPATLHVRPKVAAPVYFRLNFQSAVR